VRLSASILVGRPIETVFVWITQPEHVVHWLQSRLDVIEGETVQPLRISAGEIQDISVVPLHKGATFRYVSPESSSSTIEITEYLPPHTFSFEVFNTGSSLPEKRSRYSMTLQPVGEETMLIYTMTSDPGCLWNLIARLSAPLSRKVLMQQMRELKVQLEVQTVLWSAFTSTCSHGGLRSAICS
jgi:uncharacterized protein YndB with AHSA1/START domain